MPLGPQCVDFPCMLGLLWDFVLLQGHASNNSCKFWKAGFAKLGAGEHGKLQVRLWVFTTTKGKCFFPNLEKPRTAALSVQNILSQ